MLTILLEASLCTVAVLLNKSLWVRGLSAVRSFDLPSQGGRSLGPETVWTLAKHLVDSASLCVTQSNVSVILYAKSRELSADFQTAGQRGRHCPIPVPVRTTGFESTHQGTSGPKVTRTFCCRFLGCVVPVRTSRV